MKYGGTSKRPLLAIAALLAALAGASLLGPVKATGGAYEQSAHGNAASGVQRLVDQPRGDCSHCHDMHASIDGAPTGGPYPFSLFADNDNQFCSTAGGAFGCHSTADASPIYPGPLLYETSSHATSAATVWPGPTPRSRPTGDAGLCVNCHTPHGRTDALGPVPELAVLREETLCVGCHDASGPAISDIQSDLTKPSRHPIVDQVTRHQAAEGGNASAFGIVNRHAECSDCHNPHLVGNDQLPVEAPLASARLRRVGRISVSNGTAGTVPVYTFRAADDPTPALEYEICFKCHSSWTTQPAGQPDMALVFNTNNPSYHPVEAVGKNLNIDPAAFANGWAPTDQMYCSDCHGSDDDRVAGPHGSTHPGLLVAPYPASPGPRPTSQDELCFDCHAFGVYALTREPGQISFGNQEVSRYNPPAAPVGHVGHVSRDVPCYACHRTHGSPTHPLLMAVGRVPGLISFEATASGGSCQPTCHPPASYTLNYPR